MSVENGVQQIKVLLNKTYFVTSSSVELAAEADVVNVTAQCMDFENAGKEIAALMRQIRSKTPRPYTCRISFTWTI